MADVSNLRAAVEGEEGAIDSNRWHSEGWTPRNEALLEAVLKQTRTTRHRG